MGGKARLGKETLIVDDKKDKSSFSMRGYLLKGLIVLIVIGAGYYIYIGKGLSSMGEEKEQLEQQTPPAIGWVNGILYSDKKASVVIDQDIVSEGQAVHGVKVVKIHKDKVEFEKEGNRWEQKLKEEPKQFWITQPQSESK
jgi:hypothetical protein